MPGIKIPPIFWKIVASRRRKALGYHGQTNKSPSDLGVSVLWCPLAVCVNADPSLALPACPAPAARPPLSAAEPARSWRENPSVESSWGEVHVRGSQTGNTHTQSRLGRACKHSGRVVSTARTDGTPSRTHRNLRTCTFPPLLLLLLLRWWYPPPPRRAGCSHTSLLGVGLCFDCATDPQGRGAVKN